MAAFGCWCHVYRLDYRDAAARHQEKDAECPIVTTSVAGVTAEDPAEHAVVEANRLGRVTSLADTPATASSSTIATKVFVYDSEVLVEVLEELHREQVTALGDDSENDAGDSGLGDFGDLLLPRLVDRGHVYAYGLPGYWRDLGQPHH